MMSLPLLLFLVTDPAESPVEETHACVVAWGEQHDDAMFVEITEPRILRRCDELLVALSYDTPPGSIRVRLGGEMLAFTVEVALLDEAGEVVASVESEGPPCECGPEKTTDFVMQHITRLLEAQRQAPPSADPPSSAVEAGDSLPPEEPTETKVSPLVWGGAGGMAVGGALLGAGVWMHLYERSRPSGSETGGLSSERQRYARSATVPMIAVGSGLVVAGVAVLATGLVRTSRAKKRSTAIAPVVSSGFAGVSFQGRF